MPSCDCNFSLQGQTNTEIKNKTLKKKQQQKILPSNYSKTQENNGQLHPLDKW